MLAALPAVSDPRLLVGSGTFDDAGVMRLRDDLALVQSVDFFPPIVDEPYDFGRIAAANALSDIYAMGADPVAALAVCAFPQGVLPLRALEETLAGGLEVLRRDGVLPLGGHTVKGPEFTYGLAVTGLVHPDALLTNAGARPGDVLVLTKPLGTGVLSTALKRGILDEESRDATLASMAATNREAAAACRSVGVHALTDVTGFGLLGHALEMGQASGVALELRADLPLLPGVREVIRDGAIPGGLTANLAWADGRTRWDGATEEVRYIVCDPQTSGGLLAAVAPEHEEALRAACRERGVGAWTVGAVVRGEPGTAAVVAG